MRKIIVLFSFIFSFSSAFAGDAAIRNLILNSYQKVNPNKLIRAQFTNTSGSNITSYRTGWRLDNGPNKISQLTNIGGSGLPTGNSYISFEHPQQMTTSVLGSHVIKVWVDATGDTNHANDTITFNFTVINNYVTKINLFEESSGSWCQYCPSASNIVQSIEGLSNTEVAVFHHGDIYTDNEADAYFNSYYDSTIFTPGGMINMSENGLYQINSGTTGWLNDMTNRVNNITPVELIISPTFNLSSRLLNVDLTANFKYVDDGDYYLNVYIIEDGIVGTQVNATNPYTHNNVVRKMLGGTFGSTGIIPASPILNTDYTSSYNFVIPNNWNIDNLSLLGVVYRKNGNTKNNLNAIRRTFTQILSNVSFSIFPNPASNFITIDNKLISQGDEISIYNINGQMILKSIIKSDDLNVDVSQLLKGVYILKIKNDNGEFESKFIKE